MPKSPNDRQIDYIEFMVRDIAKTKAFYGCVFGWQFKDYGPDYCEFRDGRLTGGFTIDRHVSRRHARGRRNDDVL